MKTIQIEKAIPVFGVQVRTFPRGIGEAFEELMKKIPGGFDRAYFGISYMNGHEMVYYAAAEEKTPGEAERYAAEKLIVEKGEYLTETITGWPQKTDDIKAVFERLIKHNDVDPTKPAIEWYKNEKEMLCMVRTISRWG